MDTRFFSAKTARLAISGALLVLWCSAGRGNSLLYPEYTVDRLVLREGASSLMRGSQANGVESSAKNNSIALVPGALTGTLLTSPIETDFAFNEAIPSWNGWAPSNGGFRIWMRASGQNGSTPWIEAGTWGRLADEPTTRVQRFAGGKYDLDTLLLEKTADKVQFRIDLARSSASDRSPSLRLLALCYTNSTGDKRLWEKSGDRSPEISDDLTHLETTRTLSLPFHSQVVANKKWIGRICAPSSVNMALGHFGLRFNTQDVAASLYDPVSDAFGVWHRSIQGAAQNGIRGYVRRFRNFREVQDAVEKGYVICASIRFRLGEPENPPRQYRRRGTLGHLIAIEGFAPGGKIIVNDSATKDYGRNQVWSQEDLAKVWFEKGGVAYVFTNRIGR